MDNADFKDAIKKLPRLARQLDDLDDEISKYEEIIEHTQNGVNVIFTDRHNDISPEAKDNRRTAIKAGIFFIRLIRPILAPMIEHRNSINTLFLGCVCNYLTHNIMLVQAEVPFKQASETTVKNLANLLNTEIYYLDTICNLDAFLNMLLDFRYAAFTKKYPTKNTDHDALLKAFAKQEGMQIRSVKSRLNKASQ